MQLLKTYFSVIIAIGVVFGIPTMAISHEGHETNPSQGSHGVYSGTIRGMISDSMCKFDHSGMINTGHGANAVTCTQKCLTAGNKIVLCDPKTKIVYNLTNSAKVKQFAGKSVSVTGHIDTDTRVIHVHSVKAQ
ncbi:MAG: hypothetical protein K2X29_07545 [Candidatus Obscuribacterales bacterium]|nr:hypothetical protein [Candidatus Obscuribacterales bacterium]